ncbi:hypothetical protein ES703_83336 [subsurface metagenome]|jgi:hypothetical protein
MKNEKTIKRPISITLVAFLTAAFITISLISFFIKSSPGWLFPLSLLIFSVISMLISIVLIFINLGKNRKRIIAFIISSVIFFILTIISITLLIAYILSTVNIEYEPIEEIKGDYIRTVDTPGEASDIIIEKEYGYIADGKEGLQIIDISSIEDSCTVGSCDTDGKASSICLQDNFIYLADWDSGLKIIDISDKKEPYIIGSYHTSGLRITDVSVNKDNVFVTYRKYDKDNNPVESGVQIIDVSSKESPYLVAEYVTVHRTEKISVYNDHAFVICNDDKDYKSIESELLILDTSNPEKPLLTGKCTIDCYSFNLFIKEDYAYTASENGMYIIDISDRENPAICGKFLSYAATDVFVEDDTAYIIYFPPEGGDESSLYIVSVFLKENPEFVKNLHYPIGGSNSIFIEGGYIYITDDDTQILKK